MQNEIQPLKAPGPRPVFNQFFYHDYFAEMVKGKAEREGQQPGPLRQGKIISQIPPPIAFQA